MNIHDMAWNDKKNIHTHIFILGDPVIYIFIMRQNNEFYNGKIDVKHFWFY